MDQLEIIGVGGDVEFYNLDPGKGVTNIGQHPDNDIVINDPTIAPFQAMLDHRQKPYQLMILSDEGRARLGGTLLPVHQASLLQNLDHIEMGGYTLILVENDGARRDNLAAPVASSFPSTAPAAAPAPFPARPATIPPPVRGPDAVASSSHPTPDSLPETATNAAAVVTPGLFRSRPVDYEDDVIITELSELEWIIDVEQTAVCQLTIINGGQLVATFQVGVQGLNASWVTVSQPFVNLNEGERATITLSITPPRLPTSRAGAHHFAIVMTSPNHPGRMSQRGATLTINPYYEFSIDELSPRRQTISWSKRFGRTVLPVVNKGNSASLFRLEGTNEERACNFEFDVPGEVVPMATQAEMRLQPQESIVVPIHVTPHSRRLIGFRKRTFPYTVTTTLTDGQQTPRSMLGELAQKPLIGPWAFLLLLLVLMCAILYFVQPWVYNFMFITDGTNIQTTIIRNETPVAIRWESSIFTNQRDIDPPIEGLEQPLPRQGTVIAYPTGDTTYTFSGSNILSRIAPPIFPTRFKEINVEVVAIPPEVNFEVSPGQVVGDGEEEVVISWRVVNADTIKLFRQVGENGPIEEIGEFTDQPIQSLRVTPDPSGNDTFYILAANNKYIPTPTLYPKRVTVLTPTPTPPPTPEIVLFSAVPPTINEGEESTLSWVVNGVQEVNIQGVDNASTFPNEYSIAVQPTGSTDYLLTIPGGNVPPRPARVNVIPATPTPTTTPEPDAPRIVFFVADPDELVEGDEDQSELTWSIDDNFTNGEITSPKLGVVPFTDKLGTLNVTVEESTIFVLTAFNQGKQASQSAEVRVLTPTPTTTPPPPPPTPLPAAIISSFVAEEKANAVTFVPGSNPPTYQVVAGSDVKLNWETQNAVKVTLVSSSGNQDVATTGSKTLLSVIANDDVQLQAFNGENKLTSANLKLQVIPPPPPPPPFDFTGVEGTNVITLSWKYDSNSKDQIEGFRIYSTSATNTPLFDEGTLDENATSHVISVSPTCGNGYYVVAVYIDIISNNKKERPTTNTWFSKTC